MNLIERQEGHDAEVSKRRAHSADHASAKRDSDHKAATSKTTKENALNSIEKNNRNIEAAIWAEDVEAKTVEGMFNEAQVPFNQNGKNSFAFTVDLCNFISCVRQVDTSVLHGERLTNLTTVNQLWEFLVTALELPVEEDKDAALFANVTPPCCAEEEARIELKGTVLVCVGGLRTREYTKQFMLNHPFSFTSKLYCMNTCMKYLNILTSFHQARILYWIFEN